MRKILRKPIMSVETGGKGCRKSCDVRKRAENIGEPRKSLLRDSRGSCGFFLLYNGLAGWQQGHKLDVYTYILYTIFFVPM